MLFTQFIIINDMALRAVLAVLLRGVCHHGLRRALHLKHRDYEKRSFLSARPVRSAPG